MKKLFLKASMLVALLSTAMTASGADDYGLPDKIEDGNILHCFSWPIKYIREELPNIAAAGFGAIQISPMQRPDIDEGWTWYTIYLPYDYGVFSSPGMGSKEDLKALCQEAETYGIKIIVDVALNHVNKTPPYYNPWWKEDGRYRRWGNENGKYYIDYYSRYSITHDPLGDYVELNTENAEATARGKAFIEELKSLGVKGIRYDAAKHIELPSETEGNGDGIWPVVTDVDGLFHYGEIVGECENGNDKAIEEYAKYIWVPDNMYSTNAAKKNGGVPTAHAGSRDNMTGGHLIYWAESHDDYSNDEWSEKVNQDVIDRAYCALACRNTQAALYYSRPRARGKDNIKIEKGSTAFMSKQVVEVNKFRNAMQGREDWFENNDNKDAASITRNGGGAVIVAKGSNVAVTVPNGGSYCPPGTYTDRVSGNTFTVDETNIKGTVGSTGVAILYKDADYKTTPTPAAVTITGSKQYNVAYAGNFSNGTNYIYYWKNGSDYEYTSWPGEKMERALGSDGKYYWCYNVPAGCDRVIFHNGWSEDYRAGMRTGDLTLSFDYVMDNGGATIVPIAGFTTGSFEEEPTGKQTKKVTIEGDYNIAYSGDYEYIHYWKDGGDASNNTTWPGVRMTRATGDDGNPYYCYKLPEGMTHVIFNNGNLNAMMQTGDLAYTKGKVMCNSGATEVLLAFTIGGEPVEPEPPVAPEPEALSVVWPTEKYCYVVNSYNWSNIKIHAWDSNDITSWPGVGVGVTNGLSWANDNKDKLIYKVPKSRTPNGIILSNNGDDKERTGDLAFENGATYYCNGGHIGGDDNISSNPNKLYILGSFPDYDWETNYGVDMEKIDDKGVYVAYGVEFSGSATFSFTTATGDSWDILNSTATRFGAPDKDTPITPNSPKHIARYAGDKNTVGGCQAWQITKGTYSGTYDVIVDLYDMTVTLLKHQDAPEVQAQQLAKVKPTAVDAIRNYDYITMPNGLADIYTTYGVNVNGTNITVTELTPDYIGTLGRDDVEFIDKALVTTTFSGQTSYGLEPQTASIGKKQSDGAFRGIVDIDLDVENTILSKVNYYYTIHEGVEVKVPLQTPVGSATLNPYGNYYLAGEIKNSQNQDGQPLGRVTYGNPSFHFQPGFEIDEESETLMPVYTLEVGSLKNTDTFTVQTGDDPGSRRIYAYDAKKLQTGTVVLSQRNDAGMYFETSMLNITFTLTDVSNPETLTIRIEGKVNEGADWAVTAGNDKTNQSGSVTPHSGSNYGTITMSTVMTDENNRKVAYVSVYAPEGTKQVYYTDEPYARNANARHAAPADAQRASRQSDGHYTVPLYEGSGLLTLYTDNDETDPVAYLYTVDGNDPLLVEGVEADRAEAEYFTLQGVRVAEPTRGIYIRVSAGKAEKVVIR